MERDVTELEKKLAKELVHARLLLEKMGDDLSADIDVVTKHMVPLQTIDIVMQMLGHIAAVVEAEDRHDAVDNIGMHELKMKLLHAA